MKDKLLVTFCDYLAPLKPPKDIVEQWSDNIVTTPMFNTNKGLRVTLEATHSGIFNENLRIYIPSRMEEGVESFKTGKPAKILKHHDSHADPVGIIRDARYVSTIPDGMENLPDVKILTDSSFSIERQVEAARDFLKSGIPFSKDWRGFGYIELVADIMDPATISQINDGRFDSVSTSFASPGHVYCTICLQNLAEDGLCEHVPGNVYKIDDESEEKAICTWIPGVHDYKECSLVVFDADPLTAITISTDNVEPSIVQNINLTDEWKETFPNMKNNPVYEFKDFNTKEDVMLEKPDNSDKGSVSDSADEVLSIIKKHRPEIEDEALAEFAKKITAMQDEDGQYPNQAEAEIDNETAVLYALEAIETVDEEIDPDAVYAEMEQELENEDAKLSAEQRKKLSASTFCGPDRSFPVPDCAHVTAARRLIGRYKGPGDKSKILACVNRKAKALGCDSKEDSIISQNDSQEPVVEFNLPSCEELKTVSDENMVKLFSFVESELISRQLKVKRDCSECAANLEKAESAEKALSELKDELASKENVLSVLRDELHSQYRDYAAQVDEYVVLSTELHKAKLDKIALISVLDGKHETLEKAFEDIKDIDVNKEGIAICDSFDLNKVVEKLNDGMARTPNPEEKIDNPAVVDEKDNAQTPAFSKAEKKAYDNIKKFIKDGEDGQAYNLFVKMKQLELFGDILTFNDILADVKSESTAK